MNLVNLLFFFTIKKTKHTLLPVFHYVLSKDGTVLDSTNQELQSQKEHSPKPYANFFMSDDCRPRFN